MASRASRARARAARPPPPPRPPAPAPTGSRGRRPLLLLLGGWRLAGGGEPRAAAAAEAASIAAWTAEGLAGDTEGGWTAAPGDAGVLYRVVEPGAGDAEAGVFDPPAAFKTFPFVSVRFSVYGTDGTLVDSTEARGKASWDYQVSSGATAAAFIRSRTCAAKGHPRD